MFLTSDETPIFGVVNVCEWCGRECGTRAICDVCERWIGHRPPSAVPLDETETEECTCPDCTRED